MTFEKNGPSLAKAAISKTQPSENNFWTDKSTNDMLVENKDPKNGRDQAKLFVNWKYGFLGLSDRAVVFSLQYQVTSRCKANL